MAKFRIEYIEEDCTGDGVCAGLCPDNWEMIDKEGQLKAKPKAIDIDDIGCNMDAAEQCPAQCIHIIEVETGNKLV